MDIILFVFLRQNPAKSILSMVSIGYWTVGRAEFDFRKT
nr:MAG TPA: hypothetical protein [Caudoviricetes sp.]